jgi:hypothetical protein
MISSTGTFCIAGFYAIAIAVPGPGVEAIGTRALRDLVLMSLSAFGLALPTQSPGKLFVMLKLRSEGPGG